MAEKISITKGFDNDTFDTYVPELSDNADIQNALELFYYGNSEDGNATGDVSLHENLVNFDTRITSATSGLSGHIGAISDVHGVGAGNEVVGTGKSQTLTNKTLTSPTITSPSISSPSISSPTVTGTAILPSTTSIGNVSSTEISYLDGVTSSIQTQVNTNTPTGMISIHAGSTAPTGWLLCDGTSYASASYTQLFSTIGYTFGGSGANFNVPNLKGRVVVGIDASQASFDTRGETGGAMTHQHVASNTGSDGSHTHTTADHSHNTTDHSHNTDDHSHYADHSHNYSHAHNISGGSHSHGITGSVSANNTAGRKVSSGNTSNTMQDIGHAHGDNFSVSTDSSHAHTVDAGGGGTSNANGFGVSTGGANAGNTTSGASTGNTTGGASAGNTTNTATPLTHSHTTPASDALSNLQPYIALNYIIKI
jgi:microcystin-dependent protein